MENGWTLDVVKEKKKKMIGPRSKRDLTAEK